MTNNGGAKTFISKGNVVALFAFDIGLEVSLEQLGSLLESAQIPATLTKEADSSVRPVLETASNRESPT